METRTYLTTQQVSEKFHIPKSTLVNMRWRRVGPDYVKFGRRVLYSFESIEQYLENRKTSPEG